ncbi:MAG: D-aminoacylase, partial [Planctomycetes bacterium]|nr:D-aminoacylase [Planctomycetota bacterium]
MAQGFDILIRGGLICDGSGRPAVIGDVGINGDIIALVGQAGNCRGTTEIDAAGLAVAPGFINMLSWAGDDLLVDGRSQSDIRQGVTLEVMGEGSSMGPWNDRMKAEDLEQQGDIGYDIRWTTLGEYLDYLVRRGVSTNVASFVGATTVRIHELGHADRRPTPDELEAMCRLVREARREGAMGVASSLSSAPAAYADTAELIALARAAGECGGMYISHMRNEADHLLEAFDEFLTITRAAHVAAEIYHLKASGQANWAKLPTFLGRIEEARDAGLAITADMYTYEASSTGLDAVMPPWVQEGGHKAWVERLKDPAVRDRVRREMNEPASTWDNGYTSAGGAKGILLIGFKQDQLKPLTGKSLAEVAAMRGTPPEDTAMDLVIEDDSRVASIFFSMSEDNVRTQIRRPWMSFCSDGGSISAEGVFLKRNRHPRTYGAFARLLGRYVRDERLIRLEEAVRRLTSLPAANLKIANRGRLAPGFLADVVVFDPATIRDNATYDRPHQYATGVHHVLVNGTPVIRDGDHTHA